MQKILVKNSISGYTGFVTFGAVVDGVRLYDEVPAFDKPVLRLIQSSPQEMGQYLLSWGYDYVSSKVEE